MEEIVISIGEFIYLRNGAVQDTQRRVHFTGEKIGCRTVYGEHNGLSVSSNGSTWVKLYGRLDH